MRITISPISNTVNIVNIFKSTFFAPDCTDPAVAAPFNLTALTIPVPSARPMLTVVIALSGDRG
jgi:hypothetical protein